MREYTIIHKQNDAEHLFDECYTKYIDKYGHHFNDVLAEFASHMMENSNGIEHTWSTKDIETAIAGRPYSTFAPKATLGDITYLANMAYADFFPSVLNTENKCVDYALAVAQDKDGYEGLILNRWLADIMGKHVKMNWKEYYDD